MYLFPNDTFFCTPFSHSFLIVDGCCAVKRCIYEDLATCLSRAAGSLCVVRALWFCAAGPPACPVSKCSTSITINQALPGWLTGPAVYPSKTRHPFGGAHHAGRGALHKESERRQTAEKASKATYIHTSSLGNPKENTHIPYTYTRRAIVTSRHPRLLIPAQLDICASLAHPLLPKTMAFVPLWLVLARVRVRVRVEVHGAK
jgi:hypothetical protein